MVKPRSEALIGWEIEINLHTRDQNIGVMVFNIIFNVISVIYRGSQFLAHLAKGNVSFCHQLASRFILPSDFRGDDL
jgi:hypothetical protein